ncbi:phosphate regulon sensor histidine kinase PhoR [Comamonas testosteroni]|uniref:phosphate regulon sensor histidine kinase PhoR n=1 Tax=Comamonas testosteroni TaxID=285 RepID=UPI0002D6F2C9|nr:phosphate regulon sensor histidine kinase PhoR [Comamonas testosteroni]
MLASQIAAAMVLWLLWAYLVAPDATVGQQTVAAMAGALIGGWIWWLVDSWNGARLLRWLRQSELDAVPNLAGIWGEAGVRMRRWIRQSVQQVQQGDQRLNDILSALQASPNGVVLLDAQGRIEWCNQIAAKQFGFDAERDVLQSIGNLVRNPQFSAYFVAQDFTHDLVMQGRESTPSRPVKLSVQLYGYGEGRKLLLARDVTALEQAEAMRRDFVANVSHEIRTPLTVLAGFVETLQNLPLEEAERNRYLELMAQQAERMQHLVEDLLTLSRLEGSPLPGNNDWVSVAQLLTRCENEARGLSNALTRKQSKPHVLNFPDEQVLRQAGELAGASAELHSAFSNLLANAMRYTPAGGQIDVRWQLLPDGSARFAVKDSGPGIDERHVSRLTERFYRVDRSRSRDTGGTGLGLAIVKHVLQRHGAKLSIESELGKGSEFAVTFPPGRVRAVTEVPVKTLSH